MKVPDTNIKFSDKIKAYFEDELKGEQLVEFEKELETNEELSKAIDMYFAQTYPAGEQGLEALEEQFLRGLLEEASEQEPRIVRRSFLFNYGVAASLAFLLIASAFLYANFYYSNQYLAASFYDKVKFEAPTLAGGTTSEIYAGYKNEDWSKVIRIAEASEKEVSANEDARFLLACAYHKNGQYELAVSIFQELLEKNHIQQQRIHLLMALSYLQADKLEEAQAIVKKILEDKGNDFSEEAQALRGKLMSKWRLLIF